jgi:hypothetical protein
MNEQDQGQGAGHALGQTIDALASRAQRAGEAISHAGDIIAETAQGFADSVRGRFGGNPAQISSPIPAETRVVRPTGKQHRKGTATWLAWREDRWVPIHRVAGIGWVWSE